MPIAGTLGTEEFITILKDKVARVAIDDFNRVKDKSASVRDTIFNVRPTKQPIFRRRGLAGGGYPVESPDGTLAPPFNIALTPEIVYRVVQYRRSIIYTIEMMESILNNAEIRFVQEGEVFRKMLDDADDMVEDVVAGVFINAFTSTEVGADGKPLCATDHPILLSPTGQTYANTPSTSVSLSPAALNDAFVNMRTLVDNSGAIRGLTPKYLLVPPQLEVRAKEILHSEAVPYSAENTVNVFQNSLDIIVWDRLTFLPTAWFLLTDKAHHSLNLFTHTPPSIVVSKDIDYKTRTLYTEVLTRFAYGFDDWRGVYGAAG